MADRRVASALALFAVLWLAACAASPAAPPDYSPEPYVKIDRPAWVDDAVIYQINTRQFTPEGTFAAAERELPRLKALGVDILWLMPIHPIGEVNRKGSLGSPYSVKDYYGVNPEFGTMEDFRAFLDAAHAQGFHVILDWVANHTAWDNPLLEQHPDWYERDWQGNPHPTPWTDWSDIIDLDFDQPGLRQYMTQAMVWWVKEVGVDGFRADVAGFVPLDFWEELRRQLDEVKPVFMLAEWDTRDLHQRAFDATYGWRWKEAAQRIAAGQSGAGDMTGYYQSHVSSWPQDALRILYISNHDQNAWDGTPDEIYGEALDVMTVLAFVSEGIPLIYNGQEAGNPKRLEFFERDPIEWREHRNADLFKRLIALKTDNRALWNGLAGGRTRPVMNDTPDQVVSFTREKDGNRVTGVFNLSPEPVVVRLTDGPIAGPAVEWRTGERVMLALDAAIDVPAWTANVYISDSDTDAAQ